MSASIIDALNGNLHLQAVRSSRESDDKRSQTTLHQGAHQMALASAHRSLHIGSVPPTERIRVGDVVVFPARSEGTSLVVLRVEAITDDRECRMATKESDNSPKPDPELIALEESVTTGR